MWVYTCMGMYMRICGECTSGERACLYAPVRIHVYMCGCMDTCVSKCMSIKG